MATKDMKKTSKRKDRGGSQRSRGTPSKSGYRGVPLIDANSLERLRVGETVLIVKTSESSFEVRVKRVRAAKRTHTAVSENEIPTRTEGNASSSLTSAEEELLKEGGLDASTIPSDTEDPIEVAAREYDSIVEDSWSTSEAATHLDVGESRIRQRLNSDPPSLFGIKRGGSWRLPSFQFTDSGLVPGIEKVLAKLDPELHPVALWRWFTMPCCDLPEDKDGERLLSPLEWLRIGRAPGTVADIAEGIE